MPKARVSARVDSPTVDVMVDTGHPLGNAMVDSFFKIGAVGASHAAVQETYGMLAAEKVSKSTLEKTGKRVLEEGLQFGVIAGVYAGSQYTIERVRQKRDWKNAMLGGALAGVLLSCASEKHMNRDDLIRKAITGGALATAAEFGRNI